MSILYVCLYIMNIIIFFNVLNHSLQSGDYFFLNFGNTVSDVIFDISECFFNVLSVFFIIFFLCYLVHGSVFEFYAGSNIKWIIVNLPIILLLSIFVIRATYVFIVTFSIHFYINFMEDIGSEIIYLFNYVTIYLHNIKEFKIDDFLLNHKYSKNNCWNIYYLCKEYIIILNRLVYNTNYNNKYFNKYLRYLPNHDLKILVHKNIELENYIPLISKHIKLIAGGIKKDIIKYLRNNNTSLHKFSFNKWHNYGSYIKYSWIRIEENGKIHSKINCYVSLYEIRSIYINEEGKMTIKTNVKTKTST